MNATAPVIVKPVLGPFQSPIWRHLPLGVNPGSILFARPQLFADGCQASQLCSPLLTLPFFKTAQFSLPLTTACVCRTLPSDPPEHLGHLVSEPGVTTM
jgi:hypothetical protein